MKYEVRTVQKGIGLNDTNELKSNETLYFTHGFFHDMYNAKLFAEALEKEIEIASNYVHESYSPSVHIFRVYKNEKDELAKSLEISFGKKGILFVDRVAKKEYSLATFEGKTLEEAIMNFALFYNKYYSLIIENMSMILGDIKLYYKLIRLPSDDYFIINDIRKRVISK